MAAARVMHKQSAALKNSSWRTYKQIVGTWLQRFASNWPLTFGKNTSHQMCEMLAWILIQRGIVKQERVFNKTKMEAQQGRPNT